jgi:hypothetical protein
VAELGYHLSAEELDLAVKKLDKVDLFAFWVFVEGNVVFLKARNNFSKHRCDLRQICCNCFSFHFLLSFLKVVVVCCCCYCFCSIEDLRVCWISYSLLVLGWRWHFSQRVSSLVARGRSLCEAAIVGRAARTHETGTGLLQPFR